MTAYRPLFKYIKNHDVLFTELAMIRNGYAESLGMHNYQYHKTPKFLAEDGRRLSIEPERSIVVNHYRDLAGVKTTLQKAISGFYIINNSDIGFRYPTAAIAGNQAPFIKRFRSEYFHEADEKRDICRPINLSYGIKSRGKADNRQEYEIWVSEDVLEDNVSSLFLDKYGEDLPDDVLAFAAQSPVVHGWMGVKRAAFEAILIDKKNMGDIAICIGFSLDAYNIGANPDLSYSEQVASSIAVHNAELEWEVMGYFAPAGKEIDHNTLWQAIDHAIEAISVPVEGIYNKQIIPCNESKTERILSTISQLGVTDEQIADWNLKPSEFLQTRSKSRLKAHDPTRKVNLLGRLNRLFYQEEYKLPSLAVMHELII
ncbi:hypothetical protein [Alteromonas sp. KUL49]|uniref:hypothetical protein n=1 Tax=Alteromonas sp. KUL49 TaxID=2480798 RepID=UPI00102EE28E|nr:hypothetical protein [Alteromonas sp. KUL49]TAP40269.1 hypothetical protein EYS00_08870 [Alteromonas sp. KUL49]